MPEEADQPTRKNTTSEQSAAGANGAVPDVPYRDIGELLHPEGGRRQSLKGFQDEYMDIVHYIVKCTHDIWERSGYGLIYTHYTQNARVHTSDGMTYGRDKLIENTIQNQAAFPDLRAFADDVIWGGNETGGFYSSHRVMNISRNTGYSIYGPPTGRKSEHYVIADCLVFENKIVEEWIVYDALALVRNLGLDVHKWAKMMAQAEFDAGLTPPPDFGDLEHHPGQEPPPATPEGLTGPDHERLVHRALHDIWNRRMLNEIETYYAPNVTCYASGNRRLYGRGDYAYNIVALLAAFPDAVVRLDHICSVPNGDHGHRVAARWTFQGTHMGPGWYGAPTGKRVRLIGISHCEIEDGQIAREWLMYDEVALLKQLYRPG